MRSGPASLALAAALVGAPIQASAAAQPEPAEMVSAFDSGWDVLAFSIEKTWGDIATNRTLESMTIEATLSFPASGDSAKYTLVRASDGRVYERVEAVGGRLQERGGDGETYWIRFNGGESRRIVGEDQLAIRRLADLYTEVDYRKYFPSCEYLGTVEFGGGTAHRVRRTDGLTGLAELRDYDGESGYLVRTIQKRLLPTGQEIDSPALFEDYRDVDGMKIPFRQIAGDGGARQVLTVQRVLINRGLDEALFELPEGF